MKQRQRPKYESIYTKLNANDSSDEDGETELFVKKPAFKEVPTVEISLEEDETLQALSIRYRCTTEELKRLNNIHKENEIYARRSIKVPARTFTAALVGIHTSGKSSPEKPEDFRNGVTEDILKAKLTTSLSNVPSTSDAHVDLNQVIFNSNIVTKQPCDNPSESVHEVCDEEEIRLLPQVQPKPEPIVTKMTCSGADADISWIALIVCIVILIFAVPLIYIFYIAEHPEQFHHHV